MPLRNPRAFLDISVGGRAVGRLKFELFRDVLPISAENFRALCTGETGLGYYMQPRYYKHSMLHQAQAFFSPVCRSGIPGPSWTSVSVAGPSEGSSSSCFGMCCQFRRRIFALSAPARPD
mmetsp:Transcript_123390/g.282839  ORF Transcript_123390/g.282839 Transcript_123390/m.282839 type:complete len:120 (-) Transcript_123390:46-405(-)